MLHNNNVFTISPLQHISFIHFVRHLFERPEIRGERLAFLSNRICQDPLENFFGCQRQRGGTSDNPNVAEFLKNTQALRVVNSLCRGLSGGNCRRGKHKINVNIGEENSPLPKRRRVRPTYN